MISVFDYTDFRKFLRDRIAEAKLADRSFTYRHLADIAGFKSAGFFTQVLQGATNLSDKMIGRLAQAFALQKREALYFGWMVRYNQSSSHEQKKAYFLKMAAFKKARVRTVDPEHYDFYDKWYYSAIRAIIHYRPMIGDDCKSLARAVVPSITPAEARRAVGVLERLGFIEKLPGGGHQLTDKHITTGFDTESVVINNFVTNTLDIAKDAFYRFPKEKRNFSALTLSVSAEGYKKIVEQCAGFRKTVVDIVKEDRGVDRVYQVNLQVFPLTGTEGTVPHED
jgi:uncharacterized protein (TIGR02147 family)